MIKILISLFISISVSASNLQEDSCPVCMEILGDRKKSETQTLCNHKFHTLCLLKWFRRSSNCPLCRLPVFEAAPEIESSSNAEEVSSSEEEEFALDPELGRYLLSNSEQSKLLIFFTISLFLHYPEKSDSAKAGVLCVPIRGTALICQTFNKFVIETIKLKINSKSIAAFILTLMSGIPLIMSVSVFVTNEWKRTWLRTRLPSRLCYIHWRICRFVNRLMNNDEAARLRVRALIDKVESNMVLSVILIITHVAQKSIMNHSTPELYHIVLPALLIVKSITAVTLVMDNQKSLRILIRPLSLCVGINAALLTVLGILARISLGRGNFVLNSST